MNDVIVTVLAIALSLLAIGAPLHMAVVSVARPAALVYADMKRRPVLAGAYFLACVIGFGMFTYHGVLGILGWTSHAHWFAMVAGAFGALAFPAMLMSGAQARLK